MSTESDFDSAFADAIGEPIEQPDTDLTPAPVDEIAPETPADPAEPVADAGDEPTDDIPADEAGVLLADEAPAPLAPQQPINTQTLADAIVEAQARSQQAAAPAPAAPAAPKEFAAEDFLDEQQKAAIALMNAEWGEVASAVQPLIAASVKAALANQERQILSQVQQHLAPIQQVTAQSQEAMYWASIQQAHPDFQQAAAAIPGWIEKQPAIIQPRLREVYQQGTAGEVVELISAYKQAIGSMGAAPAQPASSTAQVPQRAPVSRAALAATAAPPVAQRSAVATTRDPNDFDSAFAEAVGAR